MFFRNVLSVLLLLTFFQTAFAQVTDQEKPKTVTADLRKEAVEFLRETSGEVGTLRSIENRISFSSELAGLMWFYDQKESAAMYQTVITDFEQLFADYDAQVNAIELKPEDYDSRNAAFLGGGDDKSLLMKKLSKAMGVRQQIAMSLAEHDAVLAFDFYTDTASLITNPEIRKQLEERDSYFETQFIKRIAEKDGSKAAALGRQSLAKGVGWAHVDLLKQIYDKDPEKGAEFAEDVVKRFKDDKVSSSNLYNLGSFLSLGAENAEFIKKKGGKKPMFTEQALRDLAELLAQGILQGKPSEESGTASYMASQMPAIEKYAPSRAVQIRAKFPNIAKTSAPLRSEIVDVPSISVKTAPMLESKAEVENPAEKERDEMMNNVAKLGSKELPKEEREKIVAQARKIINGMGNRQEKLMALSLLASQVAAAGDKELAAEVMKDAATLVNPSPKNYQDFLNVWFLASAYAATDAEKAFPLLEDAIFRLNDTLTAFIKVGEFMDVSGEMIDDGEVQVGTFGGSMVNGLTRELGIATPTIRYLAIADFGKTKALTDKFDRPEVRILAKMLVLRAILGDETKKIITGGDEF
jgi:hypothetical protein